MDTPLQQLSLFDDAPPPTPQVTHAAPPPVPPPAPRAPEGFQHPRAHREILLGCHRVAYELRRGRRRSIGFVVGMDGLTVSAPRWVSVADVEAALREKQAWILRKLHEQQDRAQRLAAAKVDWRDGTGIPFLGETVILVLDARVTGAQLNTLAQALPGVPRLTLHLGLPHTAHPDQIRDTVLISAKFASMRVFAPL
jgi:hypothetical protein